ncbi:hypothetical protein GCM10017771_67380 [Streptomyces capitiformicae]|uniref:Uncharacterized protein n=1 Tax=Streptomyces capitiformicae TaxID=2014920 RepID=A0A918ZE47_9ACTN|nr:hypothetical protein GCM10017771_67380 [Streptomyces capitiformicae]
MLSIEYGIDAGNDHKVLLGVVWRAPWAPAVGGAAATAQPSTASSVRRSPRGDVVAVLSGAVLRDLRARDEGWSRMRGLRR